MDFIFFGNFRTRLARILCFDVQIDTSTFGWDAFLLFSEMPIFFRFSCDSGRREAPSRLFSCFILGALGVEITGEGVVKVVSCRVFALSRRGLFASIACGFVLMMFFVLNRKVHLEKILVETAVELAIFTQRTTQNIQKKMHQRRCLISKIKKVFV